MVTSDNLRLTMNMFAKEVHQNAVDHGSEALREYRNGHQPNETYHGEDGKPEGIPTELADVILRVLDMCGHYGIDIGSMLAEKNEYNKARSFKHGGKVI